MRLRDAMWELFLSTGNIAVYLLYRRCLEYHQVQPEGGHADNG